MTSKTHLLYAQVVFCFLELGRICVCVVMHVNVVCKGKQMLVRKQITAFHNSIL